MLLKLLQNIDRSRFAPQVISLIGMGEIGPRIAALGIPVHVVGMHRGLPNPLKVLKLIRLLRETQPEVVHTWMYHADLLGGLAARLIGYDKVIWCLRHSNLSMRDNSLSTLMVVRVCALLSSWVPVGIVSCSNRAKEVHVGAGYTESKIHVIPNGFELDRFRPDALARLVVRAELGLSPQTRLVGLIARYDHQKNHVGFIQAASLVNAQLPDVHFVLAGEGADVLNCELRSNVAALGLEEKMHLLGRRDDVPRLMAALDVLASSSHGEAFPNVLGEAMACGVPCVVTDVGDSAEIVGEAGRVVPAGDMHGLARELLEVLQLQTTDWAALSVKARARVGANYEISNVASMYQAFYEQTICEPNTRNS